MENDLNVGQGNNIQQGNGFMKPDVPNNIGILVVGIVSLALSTVFFCFGFSFFGFIASIIGFVLAIKAEKEIAVEPDKYSEKSIKNVKIGKILNLISVILGALVTVGFIVGGGFSIIRSFM